MQPLAILTTTTTTTATIRSGIEWCLNAVSEIMVTSADRRNFSF
jgi:hypothetical protein